MSPGVSAMVPSPKLWLNTLISPLPLIFLICQSSFRMSRLEPSPKSLQISWLPPLVPSSSQHYRDGRPHLENHLELLKCRRHVAHSVAVRTLVFQHFFSIRRCLTCLSSIDLLGLQSICSPIPVQLLPSAVHLQLCISPLQSICSSPAVHLPVRLAVHLPVVALEVSHPSR